MSEEFPQQLANSVKLAQTAQGVRITVHVFSNYTDLVKQMVKLYLDTVHECEKHNITIAPMEIK